MKFNINLLKPVLIFALGVMIGCRLVNGHSDEPLNFVSDGPDLNIVIEQRRMGNAFFNFAGFCAEIGNIEVGLPYLKSDDLHRNFFEEYRQTSLLAPSFLVLVGHDEKLELWGTLHPSARVQIAKIEVKLRSAALDFISHVYYDESGSTRALTGHDIWIESLPRFPSTAKPGLCFVSFACADKPWLLTAEIPVERFKEYYQKSFELLFLAPAKPKFDESSIQF